MNPLPDDLSWTLGTIRYNSDAIWVRLVAWTVVVLAGLFVWQIMRSPWGRVVTGIRENEDAVRALGKNVFAYKMQVLVIGGVLAGVGAIFAIMPTSLQPDNYGTQTTFFLWAILLLGGAATVLGPIVGAMIFGRCWHSPTALSRRASQQVSCRSPRCSPVRFAT